MAGESFDKKALHRAAALITEALDLIDGYGGPPDAAAHLELALQGLSAEKNDIVPPAPKG